MVPLIKNIIQYLDFITIIFSFITMIVVIINLKRNQKQLDKIEMYFLIDDKEEKMIPVYLTRKYATRAEILGLLGVIQKDSKQRFNIKYLSTEQALKDIYEIQNGKKNKLIIKITADELVQFEI